MPWLPASSGSWRAAARTIAAESEVEQERTGGQLLYGRRRGGDFEEEEDACLSKLHSGCGYCTVSVPGKCGYLISNYLYAVCT